MTEIQDKIKITSDADGFLITAVDGLTLKEKQWRLDRLPHQPGKWLRYRVDQKPTSRVHEIVDMEGSEVEDWWLTHGSKFL